MRARDLVALATCAAAALYASCALPSYDVDPNFGTTSSSSVTSGTSGSGAHASSSSGGKTSTTTGATSGSGQGPGGAGGSGGGAPTVVTIASMQDTPSSLVVANATLYWIDAAGQIWTAPTKGGAARHLAAGPPDACGIDAVAEPSPSTKTRVVVHTTVGAVYTLEDVASPKVIEVFAAPGGTFPAAACAISLAADASTVFWFNKKPMTFALFRGDATMGMSGITTKVFAAEPTALWAKAPKQVSYSDQKTKQVYSVDKAKLTQTSADQADYSLGLCTRAAAADLYLTEATLGGVYVWDPTTMAGDQSLVTTTLGGPGGAMGCDAHDIFWAQTKAVGSKSGGVFGYDPDAGKNVISILDQDAPCSIASDGKDVYWTTCVKPGGVFSAALP